MNKEGPGRRSQKVTRVVMFSAPSWFLLLSLRGNFVEGLMEGRLWIVFNEGSAIVEVCDNKQAGHVIVFPDQH